MSLENIKKEDSVLYYFGDPMCSWCYGFSNELTKIKESFKENVKFELIMGGLRPFGKENINSMKNFLADHWNHVHQASGLEFNYDILDSEDYLYDTEPPSRAFVIVNQLNQEVSFDFFKDVQRMFYFENLDPSKVESYSSLLDKYKIDHGNFNGLFNEESSKQFTIEHFQISQQFGIKGFPALVLQHDEKYYMVSNGYSKAENLIPKISEILEN